MKAVILTALGIILSTQCLAINEYQFGDRLFVWAKSGLNMREAPDANSKVLIKISFGGEVVCQSRKYWDDYLHNSQKINDKIELPSGKSAQIELKGSWAKVKYENYEGYVFDAYLSRFKPAKKAGNAESILGYFKNEFSPITYLEKKDSMLEYGRDKVVFSNGIFLSHNYHPSGSAFQMNVPDFSIEEAFLLIRYLDEYAIKITQSEEGGIIIFQDLGEYQIEGFKNTVIISGAWSC